MLFIFLKYNSFFLEQITCSPSFYHHATDRHDGRPKFAAEPLKCKFRHERTQRNQRHPGVVSGLGGRPGLSHPLVSAGSSGSGTGRPEVRHRRGAPPGRGHPQEPGRATQHQQDYRLHLLDTGSHELRPGIRHPLRHTGAAGHRAAGGLRLRNQLVFQQLLRGPRQPVAHQHFQVVQGQERHHRPRRGRRQAGRQTQAPARDNALNIRSITIIYAKS